MQVLNRTSLIVSKLLSIIRAILKGKRGDTGNSYSDKMELLNDEAKSSFRVAVEGAFDSNVKHPLYLKNPKYLSVGEKFNSGPGLRIEAWDNYRGQICSPKITMGGRVSFNFNCHIGAINLIEIGNDVLIGSNVLINDHQHGDLNNLQPDKSFANQPLFSKGPVVIGDNVWLGENVCIMPGVTIGTNCVIGANSVVTKDVPDNSIAVGIPSKVVKNI